MIKISVVSYLNTMPFLYGLDSFLESEEIDLCLSSPVVCAKRLIERDVDIGLIPVVSIDKVPEAKIISDYCIGSDGKVDTVCLYSDVPISEVSTILLDYQSHTSVQLLKVLLREYWHISPNLVISKKGFEKHISGNTAGLAIGDKAFHLNTSFSHIYDLSYIWKELTGLPFVFAVWVSNKSISDDFIKVFNMALAYGIQNIKKVIEDNTTFLSNHNLYNYLTNRISYDLDIPKKDAMNLFLSKIKS